MAVRRVLNRLMRFRALEEEQSRMELEVVVTEYNQAAAGLAAAEHRQAERRETFVASLDSPDSAGRAGAALEMEQSARMRAWSVERLEAAEQRVERQREEFLLRRQQRQQVETLLVREQHRAAQETARRAQQILDDWYGRKSVRRPEHAEGQAAE